MRRKILSITTFIVILVVLPLSVYLVLNQQTLSGLASPTEIPQEVKITNISDNSFTVSWITPSKKTSGFISYGKDEKLGETAFDDKDTGSPSQYFTHHITVKNLNPDTSYFFKIGSGSKLYDDNGASYKQITAVTTDDPPSLADPAFGKVTNGDGTAVNEALVYLTIDGSTPLSSYTRANGNYLITLNNARTSDLATYITYKPKGDKMDVFVNAAAEGTAKATTDSNNDSPVPDIMLGKTYAFGGLGATPTVVPTVVPQTKPEEFSLKPIEQVKESEFPLIITSPGESDTFYETRPKFSGTGKPGEVVTIVIESLHITTAQVVVDQNGVWSYTPKSDLDKGVHKVTVNQGDKKVAANFSILTIAAQPSPKVSSQKEATPSLPKAGAEEETMFLIAVGLILFFLGTVSLAFLPSRRYG